MALDRLSLAALDSAVNDYESASSVHVELSYFLGEMLSEEKLFSVFRALEAQGLLQAYRADSNNQLLVPTQSSDSDSPADVWFLASAQDRQLVKLEWEPVFGQKGKGQ